MLRATLKRGFCPPSARRELPWLPEMTESRMSATRNWRAAARSCTFIGWLIDKVAGTGPWGLIIFLMLGFAAGILNVLRSAGLIAVAKSERGTDLNPSARDTTPPGNAWKDDEED
jgi:hypothetical protein